MQRIIKLMVVMAIVALGATSAYALPTYLSTFTSTYTAAAATLGQCVLCHIDPMGGGPTNPFGTDFAANGHNFAAIQNLDSDGDGYTNIAEINALTWPGDATSHPAATPPPPTTCSSFTYSAWGACMSSNTQTRTVATSSPAGCTGGTPVTSQSCTYVPPITTCSYTYSAWGACQSNNTQTRTVSSVTPAGCTGTPVTSQACTYTAPGAANASHIGIFSQGTWYMDTTGNGVWDGVLMDKMMPSFGVGLPNAIPVTGDWDGTGVVRVGVFSNGMWYLDIKGDGVWDGGIMDRVIPNFGQGLPNVMPVTGDWDGSGKTRIGVFTNGTWYLDIKGDGVWDGGIVDRVIPNFGQGLPNVMPVTGDWDGSGKTRIGVFTNGTWYLDIKGDGVWDGGTMDKMMPNFGQGLTNAMPVAGDWDGTGVVRVGVFTNGTWYLDMKGDGVWDGGVVDKVIPNFGTGVNSALPIVMKKK
jgi:hypothetical protein